MVILHRETHIEVPFRWVNSSSETSIKLWSPSRSYGPSSCYSLLIQSFYFPDWSSAAFFLLLLPTTDPSCLLCMQSYQHSLIANYPYISISNITKIDWPINTSWEEYGWTPIYQLYTPMDLRSALWTHVEVWPSKSWPFSRESQIFFPLFEDLSLIITPGILFMNII